MYDVEEQRKITVYTKPELTNIIPFFCEYTLVKFISKSQSVIVTNVMRWHINGALGLTQPQTEMNTRNLSQSKGQPAHKADSLTAICEPIV
jgi:hypothetical protein